MVSGLSKAVGRVLDYLDRSRDAFDYDIALSTTNEADLSAEYTLNPERYRVEVNGVRQFVQYGDVPEYEDLEDGRLLKPQTAGDVVTLRTVERFRYVVQYVMNWSLAFRTNQELTDGDVWAVGYGDADLENSADDTPGPSADGWLMYQNSSHDAHTVTIAEYRNGTDVDSRRVSLNKLPLTWGRLAGKTNWYNVGVTKFTETDTAADNRSGSGDSPGPIQRNDEVGSVGNPDGKGPEGGNQWLTVSVKAGNSTSAGSLTIEAGSFGARTLGDVDETVKSKTAQIAGDTNTSGVWQPIIALRVNPDRQEVSTQLTALDPVDFTGASAGRVVGLVVDPSKTDASGFTTPVEHSAANSTIQHTSDVSTFPDSTGAVVTEATDPGGYQIGYGSVQATGSSGKSIASTGRTKKRQLPEDQICLVVAYSDDGSGTWTVEHQTEQDW